LFWFGVDANGLAVGCEFEANGLGFCGACCPNGLDALLFEAEPKGLDWFWFWFEANGFGFCSVLPLALFPADAKGLAPADPDAKGFGFAPI
jgi:hypothetical protein